MNKYDFTFSMIKPNAVSQLKSGDIISKIENSGYIIHNLVKLHLSKEQAQRLYSEHIDRPFFKDLCYRNILKYIIDFWTSFEYLLNCHSNSCNFQSSTPFNVML